MMRVLPLLLLLGCHDRPQYDMGLVDLAVGDRTFSATDRDGDGILDAEEARLASAYLPFLSAAPDDHCSTSGLVVRVSPIQPAPLVALRYAWVFDRSCDVGDVVGDGGTFVVIVDPRVPAPGGLISMRAIARRNTTCQKVSTCGQCAGQLTCHTLGAGVPAVWAARDRHAIFVDRPSFCTQTPPCQLVCTDAASSAVPPIVNIGEPDAGLVHDLTDEGFIRTELGWRNAALMHYDPWGDAPFGALGALKYLLTDSAIDPPTCLP